MTQPIEVGMPIAVAAAAGSGTAIALSSSPMPWNKKVGADLLALGVGTILGLVVSQSQPGSEGAPRLAHEHATITARDWEIGAGAAIGAGVFGAGVGAATGDAWRAAGLGVALAGLGGVIAFGISAGAHNASRTQHGESSR